MLNTPIPTSLPFPPLIPTPSLLSVPSCREAWEEPVSAQCPATGQTEGDLVEQVCWRRPPTHYMIYGATNTCSYVICNLSILSCKTQPPHSDAVVQSLGITLTYLGTCIRTTEGNNLCIGTWKYVSTSHTRTRILHIISR